MGGGEGQKKGIAQFQVLLCFCLSLQLFKVTRPSFDLPNLHLTFNWPGPGPELDNQHNVIIFWGRIWDRDDDYFLVIMVNINDHSAVRMRFWYLALWNKTILESNECRMGYESNVQISLQILMIRGAFDYSSNISYSSIVIIPTTIRIATIRTIISHTLTFIMSLNHANRSLNLTCSR